MCIVQIVLFFFLVVSYFFIAKQKETKWKKWGEIVALSAITLVYLSSQKITTALFLFTAGIIILFNPNWQKSDRRKIKGIHGE